MPYIYVSDGLYAEIERRMAAVQTTADGVITAAIQQTGPETCARYYRERFYLVTPADARWLLRQRDREQRQDDG